MNSPIEPTIGRKVYFYPSDEDLSRFNMVDEKAPLDATIVFVHSDGKLNLLVVDHLAHSQGIGPIEYSAERQAEKNTWQWMPYQIGKLVHDTTKPDFNGEPNQ
jgi:hypothetical protein